MLRRTVRRVSAWPATPEELAADERDDAATETTQRLSYARTLARRHVVALAMVDAHLAAGAAGPLADALLDVRNVLKPPGDDG